VAKQGEEEGRSGLQQEGGVQSVYQRLLCTANVSEEHRDVDDEEEDEEVHLAGASIPPHKKDNRCAGSV
jgi:hypothetical protein